MSGMDVMTIRVSEIEKEYLKTLAEKYDLRKQGSDKYSLTKALKFLLAYCLHNEFKLEEKGESDSDELRKMIEQIHASIPHILYQNSLQSAILVNTCTAEVNTENKKAAIDYINENIAGFQNNRYKHIKAKLNKFGAKTIPIEEGESIWS